MVEVIRITYTLLCLLLSFQDSVYTLDGRTSPSRASTESLNLLSDLLTSDSNWTSLVLEVIGLMCDGQHHILQDYLREQPDNFRVNNNKLTSHSISLDFLAITAARHCLQLFFWEKSYSAYNYIPGTVCGLY